MFTNPLDNYAVCQQLGLLGYPEGWEYVDTSVLDDGIHDVEDYPDDMADPD